MADPTLGALATATKLLEYFKPSKSPYLLPITTICVVIVIYSHEYSKNDILSSILLSVPLVTCLYILYRLTLKHEIAENKHTDIEKINEDVLDQLKLGRATGISVSIYLIFQILFLRVVDSILLFNIIYISLILYLIIFIIQIYKYRIKETHIGNENIFQIALSTTMLLFTYTTVASDIDVNDNNTMYYCSYNLSARVVTYRQAPYEGRFFKPEDVEYDEGNDDYSVRIDGRVYEGLSRAEDVKIIDVNACEASPAREKQLLKETMADEEKEWFNLEERMVLSSTKQIDFSFVLFCVVYPIWLHGFFFWAKRVREDW